MYKRRRKRSRRGSSSHPYTGGVDTDHTKRPFVSSYVPRIILHETHSWDSFRQYLRPHPSPSLTRHYVRVFPDTTGESSRPRPFRDVNGLNLTVRSEDITVTTRRTPEGGPSFVPEPTPSQVVISVEALPTAEPRKSPSWGPSRRHLYSEVETTTQTPIDAVGGIYESDLHILSKLGTPHPRPPTYEGRYPLRRPEPS